MQIRVGDSSLLPLILMEINIEDSGPEVLPPGPNMIVVIKCSEETNSLTIFIDIYIDSCGA